MTSRRRARREAIEIVFAADIKGIDPAATVEEATQTKLDPYALEIVTGVATNRTAIDAVLGAAAKDWTVERMPAVDRAILRVAVWELRFGTDAPVASVIDEAVQAAKELSTEDSGRFVNGILGTIAREGGGDAPEAPPEEPTGL